LITHTTGTSSEQDTEILKCIT